MRYLRVQIVLLLGAAFAAATAQAGTLRIVLRADAQVQGDAVLLADFFPPRVPSSIRVAAESISLGSSPQIGSARRFSRDAVISALQDARLSLDSFLVPEFLTARRASKFLTQAEVFVAIQSALAKNPSERFPTLRPQDLTLENVIEVPEGQSGLEVTQMSFDESIRRARFRLWPRNAPGTLPFFVTASASIPADRSRQGTALSTSVPSLHPGSPILVDPRQLAHLHLHSANSSMLIVVRPLQRGRLNETIRVRVTTSGRTLQAKVVAANSLDASF
jgi:hypothetical protein